MTTLRRLFQSAFALGACVFVWSLIGWLYWIPAGGICIGVFMMLAQAFSWDWSHKDLIAAIVLGLFWPVLLFAASVSAWRNFSARSDV